MIFIIAILLISMNSCFNIDEITLPESFKLKNTSKNKAVEIKSFYNQDTYASIYKYQKDKNTIKYESWISIQEKLLQNLFISRQSPYPGVISAKKECDYKFKPKRLNFSSTNKTIFSLYASKFYTYGVCSLEKGLYKSVYILLDCKKYQYKINLYFSPQNESKIKEIANKYFNCK